MTILVKLKPVIGGGILLALAGCGGGEGVNSVSGTPTAASNPPPTAVTPAGLSPSTSFTNSMQSGTFVTIGTGATVKQSGSSAQLGNPTVTIDPASTAYYISYNASSNVYTLNLKKPDGSPGSTDFSPSQPRPIIVANGTPDPTEVNFSYNDCYTGSCSSSSYLISHTGPSGFVYSYTVFSSISSLFQSNVDGSATGGQNIAVFGFPTAAAVVPRTGTANYALDLVGTYTGTGTGSVNFGSGTYNFSGNIAQSNGFSQTTGTFQSNGNLASTNNGFSGTVSLAVTQTVSGSPTNKYNYSGSIGGMFFGPSAQELGGTFVALNSGNQTTLSSAVAYGAILGHR